MSIILDDEIKKENLKEIKVLGFAVDVPARILQIQYSAGNTVDGKFLPDKKEDLIIQGTEFDAVVSRVPSDGLSLYGGLKVVLYDVIREKPEFKGSVI